MNPDAIIDIIRRIEEWRTATNTVPGHATFLEVANAYGNAGEAREKLNGLFREGKIETGRTLNDRYIRLIN
jgi:hypothetical protein